MSVLTRGFVPVCSTCSVLSRSVPFSVLPAGLFFPRTYVFSAILLYLWGSHPLLQSTIVRADADSSTFNMKDDSSQVAVPVSSLDAAWTHSFQKSSGNMMRHLSATAGGHGKYGFWGLKSHTHSHSHECEPCLLHSRLTHWVWQWLRWGCGIRK